MKPTASRLMQLLADVQWSALVSLERGSRVDGCPVCEGYRPGRTGGMAEGHLLTCDLARALDAYGMSVAWVDDAEPDDEAEGPLEYFAAPPERWPSIQEALSSALRRYHNQRRETRVALRVESLYLTAWPRPVNPGAGL